MQSVKFPYLIDDILLLCFKDSTHCIDMHVANAIQQIMTDEAMVRSDQQTVSEKRWMACLCGNLF